MHFDYLVFNTIGHTSYMIYNFGLFTIPMIEDEYFARHPYGYIPVEFNDLFFPTHSVILCFVGILQCFVYEVEFSKFLLRFIDSTRIGERRIKFQTRAKGRSKKFRPRGRNPRGRNFSDLPEGLEFDSKLPNLYRIGF